MRGYHRFTIAVYLIAIPLLFAGCSSSTGAEDPALSQANAARLPTGETAAAPSEINPTTGNSDVDSSKAGSVSKDSRAAELPAGTQ